MNRTVTVGDSTGSERDLEISGAISGDVVFTKAGAGTLVVNSTVAGGVAVSGGFMAGGADIAGAVSVGTGAGLAPGDGLGTMSTGALSFAANSSLRLEIDTTALTRDTLTVRGNFSLDSSNSVALSISDLNVASLSSGELALVSYTGAWNGNLFSIGGTMISDYDPVLNPESTSFEVAGNTYRLDYNAGGGSTSSVSLIAVPEPSAGMTMFAGLGVLGALRRFRRR